MTGMLPAIPFDIPAAAGSPRLPLEVEVKRRLVAAMYAEGVIGGSASCMVSCLDKEELHQWLGVPNAPPPADPDRFASRPSKR